MQVLAEEILSFLKLIINLDYFYNYPKIFENMRNKIIEINLYQSHQYFLLNRNKRNLTSININSYVEFFGRIKKISSLKATNTKITFVCSKCGVVFSRNCENVRNHKSLNNYYLNGQEKNFHCQNSEGSDDIANHKITKEFSNMKIIRLFQ